METGVIEWGGASEKAVLVDLCCLLNFNLACCWVYIYYGLADHVPYNTRIKSKKDSNKQQEIERLVGQSVMQLGPPENHNRKQ